MTTVERGIAKEMMRTHDEPLHPPAEQLCVNLLFSAWTFLTHQVMNCKSCTKPDSAKSELNFYMIIFNLRESVCIGKQFLFKPPWNTDVLTMDLLLFSLLFQHTFLIVKPHTHTHQNKYKYKMYIKFNFLQYFTSQYIFIYLFKYFFSKLNSNVFF